MVSVEKLSVERVDDPYERLPRCVLQDEELSIEARGIWAFMMSLPVDWDFSRTHLKRATGLGDTRFSRCVKELTDAGLLTVEQDRGDDGGFVATHWVIRALPHRSADNRSADIPSPDNRATTEETSLQTTHLTEDLSRDSLFEEFWDAFADKRGKGGARRTWNRKVTTEVRAREVIAGAERYAQQRGSDSRYWKMAQGWLNDERWGDEHVVVASSSNRAQERQDATFENIGQAATDWDAIFEGQVHSGDMIAIEEAPHGEESS